MLAKRDCGTLPFAVPDEHAAMVARRFVVSDREDDRHRPVVDELDPHARAEDAGLDLQPEGTQRLAEGVVERLGLVRRRRGGEARPVSLARVAEQRELAHREHRAAGVHDAAVELAGVVLEDTELRDLRREADGVLAAVAAGDAEQDEQPAPDLADRFAADTNGCARDALDDSFQLSSSLILEL
jgi:hypothetical protein